MDCRLESVRREAGEKGLVSVLFWVFFDTEERLGRRWELGTESSRNWEQRVRAEDLVYVGNRVGLMGIEPTFE